MKVCVPGQVVASLEYLVSLREIGEFHGVGAQSAFWDIPWER